MFPFGLDREDLPEQGQDETIHSNDEHAVPVLRARSWPLATGNTKQKPGHRKHPQTSIPGSYMQSNHSHHLRMNSQST